MSIARTGTCSGWMRSIGAAIALSAGMGGVAGVAQAQAPFVLIPSAPPLNYTSIYTGGNAGTYTGTPSVMLFNGADGSLVDPQFICAATSSYPVTLYNPSKAIQVGSEIWVTDSGSTTPSVAAAIHCFTADYDAAARPHPTYVRTITGGLSIIRGMAVMGSGADARVFVGNQGTSNGAPGAGLLVYRTDGSYDSFVPAPWTSTIGPFDMAVLNVAGTDKLLVTAFSATDNIYVFNLDGSLDMADFPGGIFHVGGSDTLTGARGICVAPSGPAGASEVWVQGAQNSSTAKVGTYRYSAGGSLVAWYPLDYPLPGFMAGVYWLNAGAVMFTDPITSFVSSNGAVRRFDPGVPMQNEIQTFTIQPGPGGMPTSGTFTLSFNGQTTGPIDYNATVGAVNTTSNAVSSNMIATLAEVSNIGWVLPYVPPNLPQAPNAPWTSQGNRVQGNVTGTPSNGVLPGASVQIQFVQALGMSSQPLLTVASNSMNNGATISIARTQAGSGAITTIYPSAGAPANNTYVPITPATTIPVYNPATAAIWPTTYGSFTNIGNGINPQYISAFTPGAPVPTNPYAAGSVQLSPNQAGVLAGSSAVITVTATPGTTPASTGLAVAANLTALGGSASQVFANPSGSTYTYTLSVPASQPGGVYNVRLTVTDAQGRTGGGNVLFTVIAQAPANYFAENDPATPNDTGKAQAQLVTLATAAQLPGNPGSYRGVWGTSTGTSTTSGAGVTTGDNYRLKTIARPAGIYLNSLSMTGGTDAPTGGSGHLGALRGLNQSAAGIGTGDSLVQQYASNSPTIPPSRTNFWYGFGRQEEVYYRVTGSGTSTAEYVSTFDSQQVFPDPFPTDGQGNPAPGALTFTRDAGNLTPMAITLYDAAFNPIAGAGASNITTQAIARTLADGGPYYLAVAPSSISNNQALGVDSPSRTFPALDFANVVVGGSNTAAGGTSVVTGTLNMTVTDSNGTQFHIVPSLGDYQYFHIYWYTLYVGAQANPVVSGAAAPNPVIASNDPALAAQGGYSTDLTATITPGSNPPSTGILVRANLSALGGSATQTLTQLSGDTYGYTLRVIAAQAPGLYSIPLTVTDAQGRTGAATLPLRVLPVPPANFVVESEPNDTLIASNPVTLTPGGGIYGHTTGSAFTPIGDESTDDGFLVTTSGAPLGIYRNRLTITSSGLATHVATIRGREQVGGSVNPFDQFTAFQSSAALAAPRFNQWYSFGRGETFEYRVEGSGETSAEYLATFTRVPVTPIAIPGLIASGPVTIERPPGSTSVLSMWVYDSSLNPIDTFGSQGLNPLTRSFTAGTYYLAVSDVATSNNLATPADSANLNLPVLGYPDEIANNSAAAGVDVGVRLSHMAGVATGAGTKAGAFDIVWYVMNVADNPTAGACCSATGACVGSTPAACMGVFQGAGSVCTPNPCPPPPSGVCCRGATCNGSVTQAACQPIGTAGALFVTSGSACNPTGNMRTPCCYADFNKVNGLSVQDIFDFLNAWFGGSVAARVGGDGATGVLRVQDIFDFLNAWFAGGC